MAAGTLAQTARQALVDLLAARLDGAAAVHYSAPVDAADLQTAAGVLDTIWTDYDRSTIDLEVSAGSTLILDETVQVVVIVQVVRADGGTQTTVDTRAEELLRAVLAEITTTPGLGIDDTAELQVFWARPTGWEVDASGVFDGDPSTRGTRLVVTVEVRARLQLT